MDATDDNLHPIFDRLVPRADKEAKLRQVAKVIWLYGLSGSGKSTLAVALEHTLFAQGYTTHLLDGDNIRTGLNRGLGFSDADRTESLRRVAEVAKLFNDAGVVVICSFITPLATQREAAREIIGTNRFLPVYVAASFETCARRDPKGLYAKAAQGGVTQFTGRDSAFEIPLSGEAALVLETESETADVSLRRLLTFVRPTLSRSPSADVNRFWFSDPS
ncbi:MAG TPA: adenylyl-sulfate kinase [Opitutaceae bacterium]|nr:adenylyl-sulfate kinase [Opitutaceae bacterium]